jgi:hypothetical protein
MNEKKERKKKQSRCIFDGATTSCRTTLGIMALSAAQNKCDTQYNNKNVTPSVTTERHSYAQ